MQKCISAIITFAISLAIAIPGLLFNKQICDFIEKKFPRAAYAKAADSDTDEPAEVDEQTTSESK